MEARFTARTVEKLCNLLRAQVDEVRRYEREIRRYAVNRCGMPVQGCAKHPDGGCRAVAAVRWRAMLCVSLPPERESMFASVSNLISRFRVSQSAAMHAAIQPEPHPSDAVARIEDYYIRISERAVPQIRQAAGITQFDLVELLANGHHRTLRERAIGSGGAWAVTPEARAALSGVDRDLHLLVFDPEREALFVAYAKADPQAERLTVTRVVTASQYERSRWQLLPIEVCSELCARSVASPQERERILNAALGDRDPDRLPIVFRLQNDKRAVWVETIGRDGVQRRIGILPFRFKTTPAADLPRLEAFWDWMRSTRRDEDDAPIDRPEVAAVRFVAFNDPFEAVVPAGDPGAAA